MCFTADGQWAGPNPERLQRTSRGRQTPVSGLDRHIPPSPLPPPPPPCTASTAVCRSVPVAESPAGAEWVRPSVHVTGSDCAKASFIIYNSKYITEISCATSSMRSWKPETNMSNFKRIFFIVLIFNTIHFFFFLTKVHNIHVQCSHFRITVLFLTNIPTCTVWISETGFGDVRNWD